MDATSAQPPDPDDDAQFRAIVAGLDADADHDTGPSVEPTVEASTPTPQPQPPPAPVVATPVRPERPPLIAPTKPSEPDLGRVDKSGHYASVAGYALSVGVGAFGQIMFLGTWLAAMLPAPGNWVAAVTGAAFAEIGMIGAGNSSLTKRRAGGRWRLLFAVACFVCGGAVTMQMAHWMPKGFGVALVFGLASFVGFLIHMTIQHSKLRDYEDRKADYAVELAEFEVKRQERYDQDLGEYKAEQRQQRQVVNPAPAPTPAAPRRRAKTGSQATKDDAIRIGVEQRITTPAPLRAALTDAGYTLPRSSTTVETWCKHIKEALATN